MFRAHAVTENSGRAELSDQIDAVRVDGLASIAVSRAEIFIAPGRDARMQLAMPRLEERPVQKRRGRHGVQFPSKTGLVLPANPRYARRKSSVCMHRACACASASIAVSRARFPSCCRM